jgi:hypothetical protein
MTVPSFAWKISPGNDRRAMLTASSRSLSGQKCAESLVLDQEPAARAPAFRPRATAAQDRQA